ncbi:MFS transporter [Streptomyces sp. NPDC051453]|uniref:MFS transporter n=1 Tax=Streptomyces sp. NPDC051453 TaxID=3154941 RepID=UPI003434D8DB
MTGVAAEVETAADTERSAVRRQAWRATWLLLAFMLVNFADKAVLGLAAKPIMHDLHLTRTEFGAASTAFFSLFSLSALLVSFLTRKMSSTTMLLIMAFLWSAAQLPMAANLGFAALVGTRVLLGVAEGPAAPVALHHLFGWFPPKDRALPVAVVNAGAVAGIVVAGPALTVVIKHFGWHAAFGTVGVIGLVWALVWWKLGRDGPDSGRTAPAGTAAATPGAAPVVSYRRILLSGTWLAAAFAAFAVYWHLASFLTWTADYLQTVAGLSTTQSGYAVSGEAAVAGVLVVGFGLLAQRLQRAGRSRTADLIAVGLLVLCAVGTALFGIVGSPAVKVALLVLLMPAGAVAIVCAEAAVGRIAPAARRGVSLGALTCFFSLAGGLSPLVVGRVVDAAATPAAGYRDGYLFSAALLVIAAVVALVWLRPERDAERLGVL